MLFNSKKDELREELLHYSNLFEKGAGRNIKSDMRDLIIEEYVKKHSGSPATIIVSDFSALAVEEQVIAVSSYYASEAEKLESFSRFLRTIYERCPFLIRFCDFKGRELLELDTALDDFESLMNGGVDEEVEKRMLAYMNSVPRAKVLLMIRLFSFGVVIFWLVVLAYFGLRKLI